MAALLDSAAVERQLLLPSARRPGLRSTTAGLPPAPQERAKARVWASSASHRDARVDAATPPLAGSRMTVAADLLHANREPPPSQSGQGAKTGISASRVGTDGTGAGAQTV